MTQDYLEDCTDLLPVERIRAVRLECERKDAAQTQPFQDLLAKLPSAEPSVRYFDRPSVTIGARSDVDDTSFAALGTALRSFGAWKKGPFSVFGHEIDAEWRSDCKWERFRPFGSSLRGRRVADIGCNNGYFMFRMLEFMPDLVVGFEPVLKHWFCYQLLQRYVASSRLAYERLGVESIDLFAGFFDAVFCMGILYHHGDPVGVLRKIHASLAKGGSLFVESQGIPGDTPVALFPGSRYARGAGTYFLPTRSCLELWLRKSGFRDITCVYHEFHSPVEQRRTDWAPISSFIDGLDPEDCRKTIEGYPAPVRIYLRARK